MRLELTLQADVVERVKEIAHVPPSDPDIIGSYPLDARQLSMIADVARVDVDSGKFRYFLESFEEAA